MAVSPEEDRAYRRGYDQGVAFVLMDLGLTNKEVQDLYYKKKVGHWRHGRAAYSFKTPDPAPRMSNKEKKDIRDLLLQAFTVAWWVKSE